MRRVLLYCTILLLLTSCVHHSPYREEYYFQAMGEDSEIVFTADTDRMKAGGYLIGFDDPLLSELAERSERVSAAFYTESREYPAPMDSYKVYGGLEGNFGKKTINTALSLNKSFEKEKVDGIKYYTNGSYQVRVPKNGLLLFSNDSYPNAFRRTVSDRVIHIDPVTAAKLGESVFGLYVKRPETMIELGFELPQAVLMKMQDAIVYVIENGEDLSLNADVRMESESLARTFTTLIRNKILADLKRGGTKPDFKALSKQYYQNGATASVRDYPISREQLIRLTGMVGR